MASKNEGGNTAPTRIVLVSSAVATVRHLAVGIMPRKKKSSSRKTSVLEPLIARMRGAVTRNKRETIRTLDSVLEFAPAHVVGDLVDWVMGFPQSRFRLFAPGKIATLKRLRVGIPRTPLDLRTELQFWGQLIRHRSAQIDTFLRWKREIGECAAIGQFRRAIELLDRCEEEIGLSLWGIQLRVALLSKAFGLDEQKRFTESVSEAAPRSLAEYIARNASTSNSEACASALFVDQLFQGLRRQEIPEYIEVHAAYQLTRILPEHENHLGQIMSVAATISVPDFVETVIDVIALLVSEDRTELFSAASSVLRSFNYRLDRASAMLEFFTSPSPDRMSISIGRRADVSNALNATDSERVWEIVASEPLENFVELRRIGSQLEVPSEKREFSDSLQFRLLCAIADIYRLNDRLLVAIDEVGRLSINFAGISIGRFARQLTKGFEWPLAAESPAQVLNSDTLDPVHLHFLPDSHRSIVEEPISAKSPKGAESASSRLFEIEAKLAPLLTRERFDEALTLCEAELDSGDLPEEFRPYVLRTRAVLLFTLGHVDRFIEESTRICMGRESVKYLIPIVSVVSREEWSFWKSRATSISSSIFVNLSLSLHEESAHRDLLRDLTDEFLEHVGCPFPHELLSKKSVFEDGQVVYFLKEVCIPPVLDGCLQFDSTRALLEERMKICSVLASADISRKSAYEDEVKVLTRMLRIDSAMSQLDKSRIYVDEGPLLRSCARKYQVLFETYMKLRRGMSAREVDAFMTRVYEALLGNRPMGDEQIQLPPDISTQILTNLLASLKDEFLNNPEYGLDSYLSMRIRHGTLSGTLSRPLQEAGLLVTEVAQGRYAVAAQTERVLSHMPSERIAEISETLTGLTQEFDRVLTRLKANRLQIWSKTNADGLFDVPLTTLSVKTIVAQIGDDWSFEDFFSYCISGFWVLLSRPLENVRREFQVVLKTQLMTIFDSAREELATSLEYYPNERAALNAALSNARIQVQREIDRVAAWFSPPEDTSTRITYDLDEIVDISVESVCNLHAGFRPVVKKIGDLTALHIFGTGWPRLSDVFFNIFENVSNHSGLSAPEVSVEVVHEEGLLRIVVENQLAAKPSKKQFEELKAIAADLASDASIKRIKSEGRSGLHKLKRLASKTTPDPLRFRYGKDRLFRIEVDIDSTDLTLVLEKAFEVDASAEEIGSAAEHESADSRR